jgi:DNA repair protein RecO (recombination protein O)
MVRASVDQTPAIIMSKYRAKALVLKKTKLREKDLIVTMLSADGQQLRAVAKGGRRPGGHTTANVELYCEGEYLISTGRSLDIICESQIISANSGCSSDLEHSAAAATICELLEKLTRESCADERLYLLAVASIRAIAVASDFRLPFVLASALMKIAAQAGIRPMIFECACCGTDETHDAPESLLLFSVQQGGAICSNCATYEEEGQIANQKHLIDWVKLMIYTRYSEINNTDAGSIATQLKLLDLSCRWLSVHLGIKIRSVEVFTGLYH